MIAFFVLLVTPPSHEKYCSFAACLGVALQLLHKLKPLKICSNATPDHSLYFYQNTLRMLNQTENKEFDELIKDIEKMKFLMIEKDAQFNAA